MTRTATLLAIVGSVTLSAQTPPAPTPAPTASISVTGCVAQTQRDGSLAAKATGTQATPETAATEANNPDPTNRYQLVDATPLTADGRPADTPSATAGGKPERTTYALRGQEKELAKHMGHRVEITGSLMPPIETKLPPKAASTAEGIRAVQVTSLKMIGTDCSAKPVAGSQ